ncbi:MAG: YdcF family protein [Gammaproteobacteria bacterium]|nr:MAG: YdcF family protein [Gammaproteobacteria bacterium]
MNSETLRIVCDILLPPSGFIVLLAIGLFFWLIRLRKTAAFSILLASVLLYFASTPFMAHKLLDPLQFEYDVLKEVPQDTQAIVVLSAGRIPIAREYANLDTVNAATLERLRYASRLSKVHQLPIIISGGSVNDERDSLAKLMKKTLETDFGVEVKWLEEKSKTTFENAMFTKKILNENSISKVLLVTHAYHMPRAMWCFEDVGLNPISAPTVFYKRSASTSELKEYIPNAGALKQTSNALHEYVGKFWYKYIGY